MLKYPYMDIILADVIELTELGEVFVSTLEKVLVLRKY